LTRKLGVSFGQLTLGNGSNELITQLIRTYCVAGDAIVTSEKAFIAYRISAQVHGVKTLEVRVNSGFKFDPTEMVDLIKKNEKAKIVFIANPNNPTGTYLNLKEMNELLEGLSSVREGSVLVVLDYAYWEYVTAPDLPDPLELLSKYKNLVILRTFSKIYGLAGIRVGYGISTPEIISNLEKVREPFNINSLGLAGAESALSDSEFVEKSKRTNEIGMRLWERSLEEFGIPFWKSQGNFILVDVQVGMGKSGAEVYQDCLKKGVILRPLSNYGLPQALRISVGTVRENEIAIASLSNKKARVRKKK
jgi:histidinol-phosphate aminotransferase